jgi:hypothetical protein
MSFERILLALMLLVSAAAWTGIYERFMPSRPRFDDQGVLVLPRHERSGARVELSLEDGSRASLSVPKSTRRPRPIVALLEQGTNPGSPRCAELRAAWQRTAFVACVPIEQNVEQSASRLRSALQAAKAEFGDYVAKGSVILAGAGDAAEQATLIARQEPSFFPRLILVDGQRLWSSSLFAIFKQAGGERVLFVCESEACRQSERQLLTVSRSVGMEIAVESRPGWLARRANWLVAGDPRFDGGP